MELLGGVRPAPAQRLAGAAAVERGGALRRPGVRGGGGGAPLRHRPPRPQAGQPVPDPPRRRVAPGEGARLRHLQDHRTSRPRSSPPPPTCSGSPLYMSPEQIESPRDVDARTDVWALGAILYKLLSGRAAFAAETAAVEPRQDRQGRAAAPAPAAPRRAARAGGAGDALPGEGARQPRAERPGAVSRAPALLGAGADRGARDRLGRDVLAPRHAPGAAPVAGGDGGGGRGDAGGRGARRSGPRWGGPKARRSRWGRPRAPPKPP